MEKKKTSHRNEAAWVLATVPDTHFHSSGSLFFNQK
jgi:hypothetical protein